MLYMVSSFEFHTAWINYFRLEVLFLMRWKYKKLTVKYLFKAGENKIRQ
jgi:hypothetical protein